MNKKKIIFELKNINVQFEKRAVGRKSLREALGARLNPEPKEKTIALSEINLIIYEGAVSYTHLRAHETVLDLVCRLLLETKKKKK